ncbi:MAG: pantothenate synthetase, partial [Candidatus Azotimanducaceae bacterium]
DGLAMSSRNLNLNVADRAVAHKFHAILNGCCSDREVERRLVLEGFEVDYVETKNARRFGAVLMGNAQSPVRLIDNVVVG